MFISIANNKNVNKHNFISNLIKIGHICAIFCLFFAFFINMNIKMLNYARAENSSETIEGELEDSTLEILEEIDFSEIEEILCQINNKFTLFEGLSFKEYISSIVKGENTVKFDYLISVLVNGVKESFKNLLFPLVSIFVVVLICNLFNVIKNNKISGVSEIIYFVCFSIVVIIISTLTADVVGEVKSSIVGIQKQMSIVFPVLLTLMTAMGGVVSVKAYTPMIAVLSSVISNLFVYVLLPLFTLSLILSIVGNLSDNVKLTKLNGFVGSVFKWVIGIVFTIFISFLTLNGITAGASDGISIKATKYAIKNYIPLLGGYISDGFELIKAGSMLIKNATGFASIILLASVVFAPIISIAVLELGLKLLSGIIEPVGDKKSASLIYSVAKSLKMLLAVLVGVALMYFITIFLIICSVSNFV